MTKYARSALYYADDKDLFDLISDNKRAIDDEKLIAVARERGIFLSPDDLREDLADFVARLTYDWPGLARFYELTDTADRPEKKTNLVLKSDSDRDSIEAAARTVIAARQGQDEVITFSHTPTGLAIEVTYSTAPDPSKTRLEQRRQRKMSILVEQHGDGVHVRHEANKKGNEIVEHLAKALEKVSGKSVERDAIELTGIRDPNLRTTFFLELITNLPGFALRDVTTVNVERMPAGPTPPSASEIESDDSDSEESVRERTLEDVKMTGVVKSWIAGTQLLKTNYYQQLRSEGFFITQVVWQAEQLGGDHLFVELEAEFENGPEAKGFRYNVRGVFEKKKANTGGRRKTRSHAKASDKNFLSQTLEKGARAALAKITASATTGAGAAVAPLIPPTVLSPPSPTDAAAALNTDAAPDAAISTSPSAAVLHPAAASTDTPDATSPAAPPLEPETGGM